VPNRNYDIVVVTDPRLRNDGNRLLATEVRFHAWRGYTTALLPLGSAHSSEARPAEPGLQQLLDEGLLALHPPDRPVSCGLLVSHGISHLLARQLVRPRVRADHAVLVLDRMPLRRVGGPPAFDPDRLRERAEELFGLAWEWWPASPVVREQMERIDPDHDLAPHDWSPVVDPEAWRVVRAAEPRDPLPIGRHVPETRPRWPEGADQILSAYPEDRRLEVRFLGGVDMAVEQLGRVPSNWQSVGPAIVDRRSFLAGIDVFVHQHRADLREPFCLEALEAMASGAVCVLPSYLAAMFGEAATYAGPEQVSDVLHALMSDPVRYRELRGAGHAIVEERFGPTAHLARIEEHVGSPTSASLPGLGRAESAAAGGGQSTVTGERRRARVLFFTDNGNGLGHVTRLMAIARRLPTSISPVFLTMSEAHGLVRDEGFPVEYFPSPRRLGIGKEAWAAMFEVRLGGMLDRVRPQVLVVDHVAPASTILRVKERFPEVEFVWSRRGLWRHGRNLEALDTRAAFDHVLEPLDVAAPLDVGYTVRDTDGVVHVPPITLLDEHELLPRDVARRDLGLDLSRPALLVQLSDDEPERLASMIARVHQLASRDASIQLFAPRHALHKHVLRDLPDVFMRPLYPVSRYFHAFDLLIAAAGYNTFHEAVMAQLPGLFIPKETDSLDDQGRRADFAWLAGFGWRVDSVWSEKFASTMHEALDPARRVRTQVSAEQVYPGNGAQAAADFVALLAERHTEEAA
jgi:hypothetical protein